jgi:NAD dependent epimerase/dehydratase
MSWQGRKVLVTGAAGFIGSHLTEELVRRGATTRAMVHYNSAGSWGWLEQSRVKKDIEIIPGDIADRDSVKCAMAGAQVVFHLAALIAIPYSYRAPESYVRTNVVGTMNVMQAARDLGVERVIQTSTSEVYGTARYAPIDENHPLQAQSPYSASKIGADKIAEAFHLSFDLPVTIVRPFNTFGPRQSARAVIPTIIGQCLAGATVELGALAPTRDFTFVADTVAGFLAAADTPATIGETINLGVGEEISIGDLARLIAQLIGKDVSIEQQDSRLRPPGSEVGRLCSDNGKARRLVEWKPKISLREGLRQTIAWFKEHGHLVRTSGYAI